MNISWLKKIPGPVRGALVESVTRGITGAFGKYAGMGKKSVAFVNDLGHYAVSAVDELTDDAVHGLATSGFHPVAEMDPTEQLQAAMPDSVMSDERVADLVNQAVQKALKQANAEFGETLKRIADQRDALAAQLETTKSAKTDKPSKG